MATHLRLEHLYPVSQAAFIRCMTEPEMHDFVSEHMPSIKRRLVETHEEGSRRWWVVEVGWMDEVPAFARKLMNSQKLRWTQRFEVDVNTGYFSFRVQHPFPSSWFEAHGMGLIQATPENTTRWSVEVELHSAIPLFAAQVEKLVAARVKDMVGQDMALRLRYIERHAEKHAERPGHPPVARLGTPGL